jgi:hypothetical protein
MASEYKSRGLPVAAHLARGVRRHSTFTLEEYLIQESLTAYESFDLFFNTTFRPELPGVRPEDKRRVIRELAGLIRKMHDRGVSRPDIEPRNIMATPRSGGGVKLVFVDLHRSFLRRTGKSFTINDRVLELARFHKSFSRLFSQSYRIRFYREYFTPDGLKPREFQELVKRIVSLSGKLARSEEPSVIKAVYRREGPFFWFEADQRRIFLRKPIYQNSLMEVFEKLDSADDRTRVRVKQVGGAPPVELLLVKCGPEADLPRDAGSPAGWAFLVSAMMDHHGLSHYRVMAAAESKTNGSGYMLSLTPGRGEYNLAEYLARRMAEEFSGLTWDRRFLIRLARFALSLHEAGWQFPRPSGEDFWVRYTDAGTHELRLFNLQNLRRLSLEDGGAQLRNLFELWSVLPTSRADGLMMAEEYMRFSRTLATERRKWLRKFMEWQAE